MFRVTGSSKRPEQLDVTEKVLRKPQLDTLTIFHMFKPLEKATYFRY